MKSRNIRQALQQVATPFYLYDMDLLRRTLATLVQESSLYGYNVHYALKANFEQPILDEILHTGLGVDCVSGNEIRYAIESGCSASKIVFAGVGKADKQIEYAISQGIFAFNCESYQELEVINRIAAKLGRRANIALRINPDVDPMTHRHISTGQSDSKFGISYKEIDEIEKRQHSLTNVDITGLHFHIGSQITNLQVYEYLCRRINTLVAWFVDKGFDFTHVNVGGGLGIDYEDPDRNSIPDFKTYFAIFADNLKVPSHMTVHFELGRSIVGQCGELISTVLYNKATPDGLRIAIIDASMTELIRPALYQAHHSIENLDSEGRESHEYMIAGPVCESSDVFTHKILLPELKRGDLVSIKSAGAYGSSMASRYNLRDLPESIYYQTVS